MFKMIRRRALLRCLIVGIISTALFVTLGVTITNNNENDTSAASGERSFTLKVGNYVYVYDVSYKDSYGKIHSITDYTHYFSASGFSGEGSHGIFCVQPLNSTPPAGTFKAIETSNQNTSYNAQLKLLLFIYRYYDKFNFVEEARHSIMESAKTETNYNYYWTHMLASWLMSKNGYTDVWPSDYPWQNVADYYGNKSKPGWFRRASAKLAKYISDNDILWRLAKEQTLYETKNLSQRLMFIGEGNFIEKSINVQKCDAATNDCSNITEGASLDGIKFKLVNASTTDRIYNFNTGKSYGPGATIAYCTTHDGGKCSFNKLPAYGYQYKIQEYKSNSSYDLTARPQTVSLVDADKTLQFFDEPRTSGKIRVQKCDKIQPMDCDDPQGDASFEGILFKLYKDGSLVQQGTTNEDGYLEFSNLTELGNYTVREEQSNASYVLTEGSEQIVSLTELNQVVDLEFGNNPVLGSIKINKVDSETGTCVTSKGGSFAGTTFQIINRSKNSIKRGSLAINAPGAIVELSDSDTIGTGGLIAKITFGNETCNFEIEGLPYGRYQVKEVSAAQGYKKAASITVAIPTQDEINIVREIPNVPTFELGTKAADADDEDNYVEADGEAKIVDHVEYCARANKNYIISGILIDKETGKAVMSGGKRVEKSVEFTSQEACGRIDVEFVFDASELGGHDVVVFETLYEKSEDEEEEDEPIVSHEDINDEDQTVHMVYIHTSAVNDEDKSKTLPMNEDVVIEDTVDYCLIPGQTYIIRGILMDRDQNAPLLLDGKEVQSEVTVTPEEKCGQAIMYFHINTTGLSGKRLVVFESLYLEEEPENPIVKHEDIYNYDESIDVEPEVPNTGAATGLSEPGDSLSKSPVIMGAVVVLFSLGRYAFARHSSKKNAMKF